MSDEIALESITGWLRSCVAMQIDGVINALPRKLESPIERMLLSGLVGASFFLPGFEFEGSPDVTHISRYGNRMLVRPQVTIGNYRADFVVEVELDGRPVGNVIIECDGHAYHERTKDQAQRDKARDRFFAREGFVVLRFTGSEIYRDTFHCAMQVYEVVKTILTKAKAGA